MADGREHIQTGLGQHMKWHYVYDDSERVSAVYEAAVDVADGKPCMLTEYTYVGSTSRINNAKESTSTWDSDWDI